jgi:hypothetical protein
MGWASSNVPVSYSVGAQFKFRSRQQLSLLRFSVDFLSTSKKMPEYYLN